MDRHYSILSFFSIVFLLISFLSFSQEREPVLYLPFEKASAAPEKSKKDVYEWDHLMSSFSSGIKGKALDLSEDAALRQPIVIEDDPLSAGSFSIEIWLKTKPGAVMGMPLAGNKPANSILQRGWVLHTQANGSWALSFSDSLQQYEYLPTEKQRVNDGDWHQIVCVFDFENEKVHMHFDAMNVAIYNVKGLKELANQEPLVIGGSNEYFEYGSYGQWKSFNGYIDEVKGWNYALKGDQILNNYLKIRKDLPSKDPVQSPNQVKVLSWNIWHGGRRTGEVVGLKRTIDLIIRSGADIICMQETYGSGAIIADSLGFYFYLISTNLSIMSRYPIVEVYDIFKPFNSGSARVRIAEEKEIMVFCVWLHYLPDYLKNVTEGSMKPDQLIREEGETRHAEIKRILAEALPYLENSHQVPVLMCGDFNSGSHLDWIDRTRQIHNDYLVDWPVSIEMQTAGMTDSYRLSHHDPLLYPGLTWTPRASTKSPAYGQLDRIDYIYFKGDSFQVIRSQVIDDHPIQFPSDHAAVITTFEIR